MIYAQISNNIKQLCRQKGIALRVLYEHIGVSQTFLFDIEKRNVAPSFITMIKIADFLECSLDELASRQNTQQ